MPSRFVTLFLAAVPLAAVSATAASAATAPAPRIELAKRQAAAAPVLAGGLELTVVQSLTAKPDFAAMGSGPRQAGSASLRVEAIVRAREGNPYGLRPGRRVDGLILAAEVRRQGDGRTWSTPVMEGIPCQGGPHYEASFVLDQPGLYVVTIEPGSLAGVDAEQAGPLRAGAASASGNERLDPASSSASSGMILPTAGVGLLEGSGSENEGPTAPPREPPAGLSTVFTVDFTMPDEMIRATRTRSELASTLRRGRNGDARAQWEPAPSRGGGTPAGDGATGAAGEAGSSGATGATSFDLSEDEDMSAPDPTAIEPGDALDVSPMHDGDGNPDAEDHRHRPLRQFLPPSVTASLEPVSDDLTLLLNWDTRTNYSAGCGYSDATGKFAIVGATDGTQIVEVTDPDNPVEWGFIPGCNSSWRECKTWGTHAYMTTEASGCGMQIIDLSNPRAPFLASTYTATFTTSHTVFINQSTGFMYVNGTKLNNVFAGMQIFDLNANQVNLVRVGTFTARYVHDSYEAFDPLSGVYKLYLSEIYNGLQEVYDDSNKANLVRLGSWATSMNFTHNSAVNAAHTIIMTTDEINPLGVGTVYDIGNPANPVPLSTFRSGSSNTLIHNAHFDAVDPELVWAAHYTEGVRLIDLHRPSFPLEIGHYDTYASLTGGFSGCWEVWPYDPDGWAYLIDMQTGLYVVRYDPSGGRISGVVRNAGTGAPIPGATVLDLKSGAALRTNAHGVYALRADAGAVPLRVSGYGAYTATVSASVSVGERTDLDVDLEPLPTGSVTGFVRRSTDSAPIEGALVRNVASGETRNTLSDGSFSFGPQPAGTLRLDASKFGFSKNRAVVTNLATGSNVTVPGSDVTILLEPARFRDDVETDLGWTLAIGTDTAPASGRWLRVDPNGTDGGLAQSEDDHTPSPGAACFVTGNGPAGGAAEDSDVDGTGATAGVTTLMSPTMDASGLGAATIDYWRWFSNMRGSNQSSFGSFAVEVSGNNGSSWVSLETVTKEANTWTSRVQDVGTRIGTLTNQVRVRFRATAVAGSPSTTGIVEAGVDDVQLVRACHPAFNPQANSDGDELVNGCDPCVNDPLNDVDGDGICGNLDISPFNADPAQADTDADQVGDAADNCPGISNPDQFDNDRDGAGNACDFDDDNDGTLDTVDDDDDGDGVVDLADNCPTLSNSGQDNHDVDGVGDACDRDDGLITGERFLGKTTLIWDAESGSTSYNVYRGDLGLAALAPYASCFTRGLASRFTRDPEIPNPSDGFFYLVTRLVGTAEGSPGYTSADAPRQILTHCP